jgi:hypothetical protein
MERYKPRWDIDRMREDMAERGWLSIDLFRIAGVGLWRGYKFMSGEYQSARTADQLTRALGKAPGYYLIRRNTGTTA